MCYICPTNTSRIPNNAANGDFVESFNGLKAPRPHIGNRLAVGDDGNGLQLVETPELRITCPHHSETDHDRACLASFAYDENSQYPFAEYITHYYQFHALYKEKPSYIFPWDALHVETLQKPNRYTHDDTKQFKNDYNSVTGLGSYAAAFGKNPSLNVYRYPRKAALINGRTFDSLESYSLLCPVCTPSYFPQKYKTEQFFDVLNGDYEKHLREHHGIYTNGKKAPQPYIGDTLVFRDDGNGLPVNEKPELSVTCPYHLESDHRQACLASFSFNKDSQAPFAEYFTHFYESHVLHKEEPLSTARYRAMYFVNGDGSGEKYDTNYFIPLNPGLHMIAYTDVLETIGHIQPFALPPWEIIRNYKKRSTDPSYVHPFVSQDLMVETYEELLSMSLTLPPQDSDVESDSDEEEVPEWWYQGGIPTMDVEQDEYEFVDTPLTAPLSPMFRPIRPIERSRIPMFGPLNPMVGPFNPMVGPLNPMAGPFNPMVGPFIPMHAPMPMPAPMFAPFNPAPLPAPMFGPYNPMQVPAPMFNPMPMPVPMFNPIPIPVPMFNPMPMPAPIFEPFNNPMPPMQGDPNSPINPPAAENIVNDSPVHAPLSNTDPEETEKSVSEDGEEVSPETIMHQIQSRRRQPLEEEECFSEDNEYYGVEIRNHRKGKGRKSHRRSKRIDKRFKLN
ncbi:hypothetical protein BN7_2864 [Wickerhamomyces ciferrii]|uniref:Transcription regulator Rua1 C-terminal domain-containing protein n=1 Tax=Wickerhamomyces ciferrii (strain ATCC 14091 / BCRC 22168 / CBS 111 / JCM 3599 / NBRC 0793 / NRRL Y-1031 F-60-10) TaxID=1206466 RepID=K0KK67_WICCF|nr:uncharacterized protein BN7_2864 [Wickerhamomyces ciferrii]CCH43316.1 hypothetical protein BN7_2864 [Wickerhamomyces ciferrii]